MDYRSRRPPLRFDTDHWAAYSAPELDVVALSDTGNTDYLLLAGPEPDTQWERFAAAVEQLIARLGIRLVINLTAIPMAAPHTRPIGVTVHGTRPELSEGHQAWFTTAEVPGSAVAVMEYRLGEAGHAAMGFAVHVPHYLARAEYPQAARVLLDHVGLAAGLYLPTDALTAARGAGRRRDRRAGGRVGRGEAGGGGAGEAVRHGRLRPRWARAGMELGGELPSADELGAEVERFLATRTDDEDPTRAAGPANPGGGMHLRGARRLAWRTMSGRDRAAASRPRGPASRCATTTTGRPSGCSPVAAPRAADIRSVLPGMPVIAV